MNTIMSKISAPLLVGSILALGAMAFPAHAEDGPYVFRAKASVVPQAVVAEVVPEGEDEGAGPHGEPWVRMSYAEGWSYECPAGMTAAELDEHSDLLETRADKVYDPQRYRFVYNGTIPANAVIYGDTSAPDDHIFLAVHSTFSFLLHADGSVTMEGPPPPVNGDPRDLPPLDPCAGEIELVSVGGNLSQWHHVDLVGLDLVYR